MGVGIRKEEPVNFANMPFPQEFSTVMNDYRAFPRGSEIEMIPGAVPSPEEREEKYTPATPATAIMAFRIPSLTCSPALVSWPHLSSLRNC
jgi:hypothetical protein